MNGCDDVASRGFRRGAVIAGVAAAVAFLAACSGSGAGTGPASPSATSSSQGTGSSRILTGKQLLALLPYHEDQPAGWKLESGSGAIMDTGSTLTQPIGLLPDSSNCINVASINGVPDVLTNWWAVSEADSYIDQIGGSGDSLDVGFGGFEPGYALKQINWYTAEAPKCHTSVQDGSPTTTTSSSPTGLGGQALYIQDAISAGIESYNTQTLMIQVGNYIAVIYQSDAFGGTMLSLAQLQPVAQVLVQRLDTLKPA